jgi:RNA polymerase sigma-70 factor, ECF subfamily
VSGVTEVGGAVTRLQEARGERATGDFDDLYRGEYAALVRIAYGLTGSRAEAEELVQEAFVRCYRHWRRVSGYDRPGAWLRRVVLNLAASRGRRLAAEVRALSRLSGLRSRSAPVAELSDAGEGFWAAVRRLPRRQAQAIALYYGDDLPVVEVAEVMTCAEGTVRALLHQARRALAAALETEEQP